MMYKWSGEFLSSKQGTALSGGTDPMKKSNILALVGIGLLIGLFTAAYNGHWLQIEPIPTESPLLKSDSEDERQNQQNIDEIRARLDKHENFERLRSWARYYIGSDIYGGEYRNEEGNFVFMLTEPVPEYEKIMHQMAEYPLEIKYVDFSLAELEETKALLQEQQSELSLQLVLVDWKVNKVKVYIQVEDFENIKEKLQSLPNQEMLEVTIGKIGVYDQ